MAFGSEGVKSLTFQGGGCSNFRPELLDSWFLRIFPEKVYKASRNKIEKIGKTNFQDFSV
jgi:hypothetical protein